MNNTGRKKELLRRMRVRFWILTLICFAVITVLSLAFYLIYRNAPVSGESGADSKAEKLAEEIDALKLGNNTKRSWSA